MTWRPKLARYALVAVLSVALSAKADDQIRNDHEACRAIAEGYGGALVDNPRLWQSTVDGCMADRGYARDEDGYFRAKWFTTIIVVDPKPGEARLYEMEFPNKKGASWP